MSSNKAHLTRRRVLGLLLLSPFSLSAIKALAAGTTIPISGSDSGRLFEGLGAISGGGATSRLLIDYPEPYRSQILDYLFKPNYGASLTDLKIEIGGDGNATEGSEPSHMHTANDQNYNRGWEWWLMAEAKARNPQIKLEALAWSWPAWVSDDNGTPFTQNGITYLLNFLQGAQQTHNLTIDYVGIWNEHPYNATWIEQLKSAIQAANLPTQIVAADDADSTRWNIASDMANDATLDNAVDVIGVHYPNQQGNTTAEQLGKRLWASEDGPWTGNWGSWLPTAINKNYIQAQITKTIIWNLITSYYDSLPLPDAGLMMANQPWSGYYNVQPAIWIVAHTTQFTQPGWQYLDAASADLSAGGSYVTLKAPNNNDYSIIIETTGASSQQTLDFQVTGGLSTGTLYVWCSNATSTFQQLENIQPINGAFSVTVDADSLYSLTTTTGQSKGSATGLPAAPFPCPYSENFQSYSTGALASYFFATDGSFEITPAAGGRTGNCYQQVVTQAPIFWDSNVDPSSIIGDANWTNYQVSVDVLLPQAGYASVYGRISAGSSFSFRYLSAYQFQLSSTGTWQLLVGSTDGSSIQTLVQGTTAVSLNTWYTLSLQFSGTTVSASIAGTPVAQTSDATYGSGMAGIGSGWNSAQFSNFAVSATGPSPITTLDDTVTGTGTDQFNYVGTWNVASTPPATPAMYNNTNTYSKTTNDTVTLAFTGTRVAFYAVVAPNHGIGAISLDGGAETMLDFYAPNRAGNQLLWTSPILASGNHTLTLRVTDNKNASSTDTYITVDRADITTSSYYTIVNRNSGKVLDVYGQSTADGGTVDQWSENGGSNQQWQCIPGDSGYYTIVNRNSGKVLDVYQQSTADGGIVDQWSENGGNNQQWSFGAVDSGYYTIVNRNSGKVLDVYGQSTADGGTVDQWTNNGGSNQQWSLIATL